MPRPVSAVRIVNASPAGPHRVLAGEQDRRSPRSPLARRIERCFLDPVRRIRRASFTLEGTNARVHIALQHGAGRMRLVAVCPPHARSRVAGALDQARYALAARGIALAVEIRGASVC
jgi:hypothetical protein